MRRTTLIPLLLAATALVGCDLFGDSSEKLAAAKEAEGRAIGGACRHAGRAIEDCYSLNRKADKASVFAGWRDMNDYMRENKIDVVPPQGVAAAKSDKPDGKADGKAERRTESRAGEAIEPKPVAEKPVADKPLDEVPALIEKRPARILPAKPRKAEDF